MILTAGLSSKLLESVQKYCQSNSEITVDVADISLLDTFVNEHAPDVLMIGSQIPVKKAIEISTNLSINRPAIVVILATSVVEPAILRSAMQAGVKDIIEENASEKQIFSSISRALDLAKKFKEKHGLSVNADSNSLKKQQGKIITFFSTKGGVGKSFISANVAVALAKTTKQKIAILDLDIQFGDVAIMLQLKPEQTIFNAVQVFARLDDEMLNGFLVEHSSGVKALLAPIKPHEADSIKQEHVKAIINLLKKNFDFVIIDTPPSFTDVVLTALDESDEIYLIATMDMPSIKNIKLAYQTLKQLNYSEDKIKLILNRADSKVWLEINEVEKSLQIKSEIKIPSDRIVPRSVNKGVPVVIEQPKSNVSKSIFELASKIIKNNESQKPEEKTLNEKKPNENNQKNQIFPRLIRRT